MTIFLEILTGVISFFLGIFFFASNIASLFIGLPLALREKAKKRAGIYAGNIAFGLGFNALVITLMCTVLSNFSVPIIIGYFLVPLVIFFCKLPGYIAEAKDDIAREKLKEMGVDVSDPVALKKHAFKEITEELRKDGVSQSTINNMNYAFEQGDPSLLTQTSIFELNIRGIDYQTIKGLFNYQ
jgi:hypothetical protein